MEALSDFAHHWGFYVALVLLQFVLSIGIGTGYRVTHAWLDRRHPDDLPTHAGQWLRETLVARGIDTKVRLWVVPQDAKTVDAFLPRADAIVLGQRTFFKNDPSFWAIAAHELGHVLVRLRAPWVHRIFLVARVGAKSVASIGAVFMLANILYGSHELTLWALYGYGCALVLGGIVLIDEAAASVLALRVLAADSRLSKTQMRAARIALGAAFSTYLGTSAGQIIALLQSEYIARAVEASRHFSPGDRLAGATVVIVWMLIAVLAARGLLLLVRAVKPPAIAAKKPMAKLGVDLIFEICVALLLWLVWDQTGEEVFIVSIALALIAMRRLIGFALLVPALLLGVVVIVLALLLLPLAKRFGKSVMRLAEGEESDAFKKAQEEKAKEELARTQVEASLVSSTLARQIAYDVRLDYLASAAFIPLLLAYALGST